MNGNGSHAEAAGVRGGRGEIRWMGGRLRVPAFFFG
ncbi:hypothetical protein FHS01_002825 [Longimicrobium terrae]|uniref:Uncharacterized protein n=1 Tax=Longimicrobium terrae TaxID=1639882 RepID=A0A841GZL9_9BACT|nr:hypothetical protein [Longimicrobium terrae]MBB6071197.1 hypothetical protein [Longimicrobium terrae]